MISVLPNQYYILWDIQNEVGAEISIPATAQLDGKDYCLAYLEEDFPDEAEAQDGLTEEDEDGVCVLAVTEQETPGSLFELRDEEETVLGYAEEPETAVFEEITKILLANLD